MTTLKTDFQRKVTAYLERTGVNGRQLGISALQSFGFVSRLNRGRYPNLTNADRVLRFIGEPPIRPTFQREVEAFLRVTGMSVTKFGDAAAGSQEFVKKLRNGASLHLATVDRVRQWMRDNTCASQRATIARMVEDPEEDLTAPRSGPGAAARTARGLDPFDPRHHKPSPGRRDGVSLQQPVRGLPRALVPRAGPLPMGWHRTGLLPDGEAVCVRAP